MGHSFLFSPELKHYRHILQTIRALVFPVLRMVLTWNGSSRPVSLKERETGMLHKMDGNSVSGYQESRSYL